MLPGKTYTPEDVLQILRARLWLLLVPFAVVSAATAVYVRYLPDQYRSEAVILVVPQRVPESYVRSTVTTRIEDRLQTISQQILSRTRLERIIQEFNLYPEERKTGIMEDVVERMRRDVVPTVVRGDAFKLSYVGDNPRTVMRVTERLASLFIEESLRDRETLAEGTNQFLEAQLEDARRRLIEQEKKVEEYRRTYAGQLPSQLESNLQVLQNTQMQLQGLLESINRDRDRRLVLERNINELEEQIRQVESTAVVQSAGGAPVTPEQELASAQQALTGLLVRLKDDHPDVRSLRRRIGELEQQLAAGPPSDSENGRRPRLVDTARRRRLDDLRLELTMLDRQIAKKEADEGRLRSQIAVYQQRVEAAPTRETEMTELTRDYTTLQQLYTNLLAKKEEAKISANLERRQIGEQFKILDPARMPEKPFSPNRPRLNTIGIVAGLAVGLGLVALLEYRDKSFKSDVEVSRVLALPVLAVVPVMQSAQEKRRARRLTVLLNVGLGSVVTACLAVVVYTFVR